MAPTRVTRVRRMPEEVRRLRAPWPPLSREVPFLTADLERDFRFGQRVALTERGFLLGGTIKGGSSSMWTPATSDQYEAYLRWRVIEGFLEDGDPAAYEDLVSLLRTFGIELTNGRAYNQGEPKHRFRADLGGLYPVMLGILRQLPAEHLARDELARIQVGGWGPDTAKGSAYQEGTVYLYDFAVRGARRTAIGLLLHELGHPHEHALPEAMRTELRGLYARIARANAFFGIEYLLDAAARCAYQRMAFEEFFAETYLAYTACGAALRTFIEGLPLDAREVWRAAYALYKRTFDGVEYE